jgi:hypothetical protein
VIEKPLRHGSNQISSRNWPAEQKVPSNSFEAAGRSSVRPSSGLSSLDEADTSDDSQGIDDVLSGQAECVLQPLVFGQIQQNAYRRDSNVLIGVVYQRFH